MKTKIDYSEICDMVEKAIISSSLPNYAKKRCWIRVDGTATRRDENNNVVLTVLVDDFHSFEITLMENKIIVNAPAFPADFATLLQDIYSNAFSFAK